MHDAVLRSRADRNRSMHAVSFDWFLFRVVLIESFCCLSVEYSLRILPSTEYSIEVG